MIFRKRPHLVERTIPDHLHKVYDCVNGDRDVTGIARATGISQFDAARALYELAQERFVESNPPNKLKVVELFKLCVESIYMKMVLFERSRLALEFEHELNRFASDNGLRVRMAAGRINRGDIETPLTPVELIELYKTFIGIQNNKLSQPLRAQGLPGTDGRPLPQRRSRDAVDDAHVRVLRHRRHRHSRHVRQLPTPPPDRAADSATDLANRLGRLNSL